MSMYSHPNIHSRQLFHHQTVSANTYNLVRSPTPSPDPNYNSMHSENTCISLVSNWDAWSASVPVSTDISIDNQTTNQTIHTFICTFADI